MPAPLSLDAVMRTTQPLTQAAQLPGAAFTDPAVLDWEREHIFAGGWVCAGHVDRLRTPGQFVAVDDVVVVVGDDGAPRAFVNQCRHRGARVVTDPEGTATRLRCPYHAWTYGLDGTLRDPPFTEGLEDFRACDHGLHPVPLEVVEGLVMIGGGRGTAAEHLGDLAGHLARYRTAQLHRAARRTYAVAANWKVIGENYSECLHCPGVHPELNRLSHYLSGEQLDGEGAWCGGPMTLAEDAVTMGSAHRPPIVDTRQVLYFALFPNALVSLHPDYVMLHTLWPRAVDRTDVVCEWYFDAGVTHTEDAVEFWDTVNRQDWHVCELTQLGMGSRRYTPGRYTTQESDVHAFDLMVAEQYLHGG